MRSSLFSKSGFTLIEILMTILLLGALSFISIGYFQEDDEERRFDSTVKELEAIKIALIGNENEMQGGERTSFGIQGDIGDLPATLSGLLSIGAIAPYTTDASKLMSGGWNGPYLKDDGESSDYLKDGWGNDYQYSPPAGEPITIKSLGADNQAGGDGLNSDIIITLSRSYFSTTVQGIITQGGNTYSGNAEIELYTVDGLGAITTLTDTITAIDNGAFLFNNVSFGKRAFKVFIPSKAAPTTTLGVTSIVVDHKNFRIPGDLLNITATTSVCPTSNAITYNGGGALASAGTFGNQTRRYIDFRYNVTTAVTVYRVIATWANSRTLNQFRVDATNYDPNPNLSSGATYTLPAANPFAIQNNTLAEFYYSNDLNGVAPTQSGYPFRVIFEHNLGCSEIYFVPP